MLRDDVHMATAHLSIINTEPPGSSRYRKVIHGKHMIVVVEIISEANKLLICFCGVISRIRPSTNTINGARKVPVIRIQIAVEGDRLAGEVEPELGRARLSIIESTVVAILVFSI